MEALLSKCSGAALARSTVSDPLVRLPPLQLFAHRTCAPDWRRLAEAEAVLLRLYSSCRHFNFTWGGRYPGLDCAAGGGGGSGGGGGGGDAFRKVPWSGDAFPAWLDLDLAAWTTDLPNSTAVMHFRGGDVFNTPSPHGGYTQPPCDHYVQSFRHSGAACALLVAEDGRNPCVEHARRHVGCTRLVPAGSCGPACAFALLARAKVLVASTSSFVRSASGVFPDPAKRVYTSYCSACPRRSGEEVAYCTEAAREGLFPWNASAGQLEILRTRRVRVRGEGGNCPA